MNKNLTTKEYTIVEREGQLKITLETEIIIPKEAPVRLADAQLEELDYSRLYRAFSSKGRNPVTDPRVLFKVLAYAHQMRIYSGRPSRIFTMETSHRMKNTLILKAAWRFFRIFLYPAMKT